jgi:hypothetical protein
LPILQRKRNKMPDTLGTYSNLQNRSEGTKRNILNPTDLADKNELREGSKVEQRRSENGLSERSERDRR